MATATDHPEIVIVPDEKLLRIDLRELWQYRDLFCLFVRREFITKYRQTILGPLWYILQPLLLTFTFTFVFGQFGKIATDGVPHSLFYLSGILVWSYFVNCFDATAYSLSNNMPIFSKVYFPRLIVPLAAIVSKLLSFAIQIVLFFAFYTYIHFFSDDGAHLSIQSSILLTPLFLYITAATALGVGLLVAAFSVRYRDLGHLIPFMIQLWMYGTPIIYPASKIPERFHFAIYLNPLAPAVEGFRHAFFGTGMLRADYIFAATVISTVLIVCGLVVFRKAERIFVDLM
jgi:lipopolysaccharide transport system permease protein